MPDGKAMRQPAVLAQVKEVVNRLVDLDMVVRLLSPGNLCPYLTKLFARGIYNFFNSAVTISDLDHRVEVDWKTYWLR